MPRIKDYFSRFFTYIKTHKKLLIIPVILLVIIIAAIIYPRNKNKIETHKVTRGEIVQSISTNGTLESENSVRLSFLVGGKLTYLKGKKGDLIARGNTLATLDQRSIQKNIQNEVYDYSIQRNSFDQTKEDNKDKPLDDSIRRILEDNEYDLNKAILSVELQELARDQSVLISPINGIITRMDVDTVGVNVTPTSIFEITDPTSITFSMEVDEADIGKIQIGQLVNIIVDSYPDQTLTATVDYIDFSTHETSTGGDAYYVKSNLTTDNSGYKYRVGMNGSSEIILDKKSDVIIIPLSSVFEDNNVYVKNGNKFEKRTLNLGVQNDIESEVLEGISVGEEIATDPSLVK